MPTSLYICYFGLDQPLVQTQVIPYLTELARGGYAVKLLTFEPNARARWTNEKIRNAGEKLAEQGIDWHHLGYHKRLSALATAWDIFHGVRWIRRLLQKETIEILHGRSHVPTLMGALARKFSRQKPKLLFDIRGFMPEEYTDAGVWPENGLLYKLTKRVESWLLRVSDGFVVLTQAARKVLFENETRPVEVIPCCVDLEKRFPGETASRRDEVRDKLGVEGRRVFTHVGALGGLYLTEELANFMAVAREADPSTYALFLTQTDASEIRSALTRRGFAEKDFYVGRVDPTEVPVYLAASDVGLSFVKATYSTISRSPTKIPEYLAAGLPIIANAGVGDVDDLIVENAVGALVETFSDGSYADAIAVVNKLDKTPERHREVAENEFDLKTVGGPRYQRLYERLING